MNQVKVIYFSPTGGTKKVATAIGSAWGSSEEVDLSVYGKDYGEVKIDKTDLVIFAMPSYGGRAPEVGMERMKQIHGNGAQAIVSVGYGKRDYDDTLLEMKNACIENGFQVIGAAAGVTEHSLARKVGAGRPNEEDRKNLYTFAKELKIQREEQMSFVEVKVKGNVPYKKISKNPLKPKADKNCIFCGECAKHCPVQAISMDDLRNTDADKCISCMRCVQICPQNARSIGSVASKTVALALKTACAGEKESMGFFQTV